MILRILAIIAVNLLFYWRTLKYGYVSDDIQVSQNPMPAGRWKKLWAEFRGSAYNTPKVEHAITLAVHCVVCCGIYLAFNQTQAAFLAAILFSINPANTQGAVWLSGRAYASTAAIILLAYWLWPASPFLYALGMTKWAVSGTLLPLAMFPYHPVVSLLCGAFLAVKWKRLRHLHAGSKIDSSTKRMREIHLRKLILYVKTFSYYFTMCLFPIRLGMYHKFFYTFGLTGKDSEEWYKKDFHFWGGCVLLALYSVLMITNWGNPIGLGLWWYFIFMSMWCNIVTIQQAVAERYCYLPNVGLMLALAGILLR